MPYRANGYNLLVGTAPASKASKKAEAAKVRKAKRAEAAKARKIKKAEAASAKKTKKVEAVRKAKVAKEAKRARNIVVNPKALLKIPEYVYIPPDPSLSLTEEEILKHKQDAVKERNRYIISALEKAKNELAEKDELMRAKWLANDYSDLDGHQFEAYLKNHFLEEGYEVLQTKASGDYGVDLIIIKDKRKIAIQVKKYSRPVGLKAVQEAYSGKAHYKCHEAWVITNSTYTLQAEKTARSCNVRLINGRELDDMLGVRLHRGISS